MLRNTLCDKVLSSFANLSLQQKRNTYILKRRWPPGLHAFGKKAPKMTSKHFIYDIQRITESEKSAKVKVILTQYIEGLGDVGDILELGPYSSYKNVLLPRCGVYCTPENLAKYSLEKTTLEKAKKFSSPFVEKTMKELNKMSITITMNNNNMWTLEPWHVKLALRNNGYHVPAEAITLPEKPITGPNLELEEKEFLVTVTLNKTEKTQVRCRIFHLSLSAEKRDMPPDFAYVPRDALFPEEAETLASMPLPVYVPPKVPSKFGLARRRVPKFLKGCYYILDPKENKSYYENLYNKK